MKRILGLSLIVLSALAQAATLITGAGATFPYPLYAKWFSEYNKLHPDVQINYQSIGSGGGIRQFSQKTVDFGASDAPMSDEQLKQAGASILHIPTVLGAVVVTYNLPEVKERLQLSGDVVAKIFLGTIAKWNDPEIAKLNPKASLPAKPILVVHRSDGSGTTAIFTEYLSKVSETWKQSVGNGPAVKWPAGLGGKGNEGVAGFIKQTAGSVGYTELVYAETNHLPYAAIRNKAGRFVVPDMKSVSAAAAGVKVPADFRVSLTNSEGKASYPISGFTYLLVWGDMAAMGEKGPKLVEFLKWAVRDGQRLAPDLFYAPLPGALTPKVEKTIGAIKAQSGAKAGT